MTDPDSQAVYEEALVHAVFDQLTVAEQEATVKYGLRTYRQRKLWELD